MGTEKKPRSRRGARKSAQPPRVSVIDRGWEESRSARDVDSLLEKDLPPAAAPLDEETTQLFTPDDATSDSEALSQVVPSPEPLRPEPAAPRDDLNTADTEPHAAYLARATADTLDPDQMRQHVLASSSTLRARFDAPTQPDPEPELTGGVSDAPPPVVPSEAPARPRLGVRPRKDAILTPFPTIPTTRFPVRWLVVAGAVAAGAGAAVLVKRTFFTERAISSGLVLSSGTSEGPPQGPIDDEVREALGRLREGVASCVRNKIQVLPGTSPAVPATLAALAPSGAYASVPAEWRTPVWSCAAFAMRRPQRFQLQWQQTKLNTEGLAVAWIDENLDGKPDRAMGFRATLTKRGEAELGAIEPLTPIPPLATR